MSDGVRPHPELRRGVFLRPEITPDGKRIAAAYTRDGREVATCVVPDPRLGPVIREHLARLLALHDPPLRLVGGSEAPESGACSP